MPNHVHFSESGDKSHNGHVFVMKDKNGVITIHLGILMANHEYTAEFVVPLESKYLLKEVANGQLEIINVVLKEAKMANQSTFSAILKTGDMHGSYQQTMYMNDENKTVQINVEYSLMDVGIGVPFLRSGLHCIRRSGSH